MARSILLAAACVAVVFSGGCMARGDSLPFSKNDFLAPDDGGAPSSGQTESLCVSQGFEPDCDPCSIMGWYEDAACDLFCPAPDPACSSVASGTGSGSTGIGAGTGTDGGGAGTSGGGDDSSSKDGCDGGGGGGGGGSGTVSDGGHSASDGGSGRGGDDGLAGSG